MKRIAKPFFSLLIAGAFFAVAQTSRADIVYQVQLDTSPLLGAMASLSGPFALDFQLNIGSGTATNTVTLSNFVFSNGAASGSPIIYSGNPTGNLSSSMVLTSSTSNPFNEIAQGFTASTSHISFWVDSTTNLTGTTPAQFSVSIDDSTGFQIPTTGPDGISLLLENIQNTPASTLAGLAVYQSSGVSPAGFDTSGVTSSVPESGPGLWVLLGLAGVVATVSRRPARAQA